MGLCLGRLTAVRGRDLARGAQASATDEGATWTTSAELRLESDGHADQLGIVQIDSEPHDQFLLEALTTMARSFADAGAVRTIVNGNLSPDLVAALAGPRTELIELDAAPAVIRQRIATRHGGSVARLAGDDLEAATPATQEAVFADAQAQRDRYIAARLPSHRMNVDADEPARHVAAILRLLDPDGE